MAAPSNDTLTAIKYAAGMLTAFYGVYATATNFKKKREDGEEVLSKWGWIGIVMLVIASTMSLSFDVVKDRRDDEERVQKDKRDNEEKRKAAQHERDLQASARRQEAQIIGSLLDQLALSKNVMHKLDAASTVIRRTSTDTQKIIGYGERSLQPIRDVRFSYWIDAPLAGTSAERYVRRVGETVRGALKSPPDDNLFEVSSSLVTPEGRIIDDVELRRDLLPRRSDETAAYNALAWCDIQLAFFLHHIDPSQFRKRGVRPNLTMDVTSGLDSGGLSGTHRIQYEVTSGLLKINAFEVASDSKFWRNDGSILGIPDLEKSQLFLTTRPVMGPGDDEQRREMVKNRSAFVLSTFVINMTDGREFWIRADDMRRISLNGENVYVVDLSKVLARKSAI